MKEERRKILGTGNWLIVKYLCLSTICIFGLISIMAPSCPSTSSTSTEKISPDRAAALKDPEVLKLKQQIQEKQRERNQLLDKPGLVPDEYYWETIDWETGTVYRTMEAWPTEEEDFMKLQKEIEAMTQKARKLIIQKQSEYRKKAKRREAEPAAGGGGGGHCFPADTLVFLNGEVKRITEVQIGDQVISKNVTTGKGSLSGVVKVYDFAADHYYLLNGKIKATAGESFYTLEGWKKACDLKVGDRIRTLSGGTEEIVSKERVTANLRVYNIRVDRNDTFFISPDGEAGYLVHNK